MVTTKASEPKKPKATPAKPATPAVSSAPDPAAQAAATKKNHKVIIILAIIAAILFLVLPAIALTVGGIFLGKKIEENGVKFDANSNSVSITDKNGNEFSAGEGQKLPADFPTSVPLYQGDMTATGKINTDGKTGWTVAIGTNDDVNKVTDSLTKSYSSDGWMTDMSNSTNEGGMIIATKGDLRVNIYYSAKDGKTSILYTVVNGAGA